MSGGSEENPQRGVGGGDNGQDDIASIRSGPLEDAEEYLVCATKVPTRRSVPSLQVHVQTGETTKTDRCLILCFDGTKHQQGDFTSGVLGFFTLLSRDKYLQPTYYQPVIGTTIHSSRLTYAAVAPSIKQRIMHAYEFLMDEYEKGDRICLFGFASGAYTARALAGMLHVIGLLEKSDKGSANAVYDLYARDDEQYSKLLKEARSRYVKIEFVGVWETTASPGSLPYMKSNPAIKTFRHALALDEHRSKYAPLYYTSNPGNVSALEVWFSGCHDDLGGGSAKLPIAVGGRASLARISLRWMVGECFDADTSILFKEDRLQELLQDSTEDRVAAGRCHIQDHIQDQSDGIPSLFQRFFLRERIPPQILSPPEVVTSESTDEKHTVCCHTTVQTRKQKYHLSYEPKAMLPPDTEYVESNLQSVANLLGLSHPTDQSSASRPKTSGEGKTSANIKSKSKTEISG